MDMSVRAWMLIQKMYKLSITNIVVVNNLQAYIA